MITRRDFLNGVALAVSTGLGPWSRVRAAGGDRYYPPALLGLRGNHPGAFEVAHGLVRGGGSRFPGDSADGERFDLVVVGAGISGLSAARFYQQQHGRQARILIIENHDDFGGHAKRNEFDVNGTRLVSYGGSESLQSPRALFSNTTNDLLKDLAVDLQAFNTAFDRTLYPSLGLSRGVFFDRENFGRDALVTGDGTPQVDDDIEAGRRNGRPFREFIGDFPLTEDDRAALLALHEAPGDYLEGMSLDARRAYLRRTSYRDYLLQKVGLSPQAVKYFSGRSRDFMALGIDAVPAGALMELGYPGFAGLHLPEASGRSAEMDEPYIYHFPDGNASLARLLVRRLIPGTAPGDTMDDIVLAPFDYAGLEADGSPVQLRLNSTAVHVQNRSGGVDVGYVSNGRVRQARARHCVLACNNAMIPFLMPELPAGQREALRACVKMPLVYSKVAIRNWEPFLRLGVHEIYAPTAFSTRVKLDYPVTLGGYRHSRRPQDPMVVHMVHVPVVAPPGTSARDQARAGQAALLATPFLAFEAHIRDQLDRMLGAGGFDSRRDIRGITVNRWSHGYSYSFNSLFDGDRDEERIPAMARQRAGRVTIANADAAWSPYAHAAIDQAWRAVAELASA
jgi:spermidine dehydrogenase